MYRITEEIVEFLNTYSKNPDIPGMHSGEEFPYKPKNKHSIGMIEPAGVLGSELDYVIEYDHPVSVGPKTEHMPVVDGFWVYKSSELKPIDEEVKLPRFVFDSKAGKDEYVDFTDCFLKTPSAIDKLTCPKISDIKRLLELEPNIKDCLRKEAFENL